MYWLLLAACGPSAPANPCDDDATVLVTSDAGDLTCADARVPTRYLRLLAGRPLPAGSIAAGVGEVRSRFQTDPDATRAWLGAMRAAGAAIEAETGVRAAELRAAEVWRTVAGAGPITQEHAPLWNLIGPALSVRARADDERLALTESDIEGFIQYASLCQEARGGGPLRVSIAQRAELYAMASDRFAQGDRRERVALTAFGPVWEAFTPRWKAASAEAQQAWIADAPLPTVESASSLAFFEAVLEGDLPAHAESLHRHFGPLHVRDGAGAFAAGR